jgi:LCP family protein required for cell wall assembly
MRNRCDCTVCSEDYPYQSDDESFEMAGLPAAPVTPIGGPEVRGMAGGRPSPETVFARPRRGVGRRLLRGFFGLLSIAVLVTSAGGWVSSTYLDHKIRRSALFLGLGSQGTEKKDSAGRIPMNILVIGSDTRSTAADCEIGGGCGPGENADVEMLVHLAANRTNATVMSIPRDTITDVPRCTDPTTGHVYPAADQVQINSSLQHGGPGCTVAAVHALTGITIDHFAMIDFSGVVNMSDAVGGVSVCVDHNVYDTYSGLKLSQGTHTLTGQAALEFLRTRHGFGNGGDVGREAAQHVFLSALITKLKSGNTLANPVALYGLAKAATKALTVDDGLAGISHLVALAGQLNDVPANRITFITMPNIPYPTNPNWLSPGPDAPAVFQDIIDDRSFAGGTPAPAHPSATHAPTTGAPAAADLASVPVAVENGGTGPATAPAANALNAAAAPGCVTVSTQDTTQFGTPMQAYALNPQIPNSAP